MMDPQPPDISVIVPTLNEAENLPELARRVAESLAGTAYEIVIVDDNSQDNTQQVAARLAQQYPVRLLSRESPKNGLSGAVLDGMGLARGKVFVVMDGDLQHPPERIGELVAKLDAAEFVIGSRYMPGGGVEAGWGAFRKINSATATVLARPFTGRVTDPMSGFFAVSRETVARGTRLTPLGYKIGLELMCKCRVKSVREIPIHFANRVRGESKLNFKQQFKYLEHLSRLYDFFFPRLSPVLKFLIVTALGWSVALALYCMFFSRGASQTSAIVLGYIGAIVLTSVFHLRYVRTQREFLATRHPWIEFWLTSAAELGGCYFAAVWFSHKLAHPNGIDLPIISFTVATAMRYVLRKELMQDIRGLRRDLRLLEHGPESPRESNPSNGA